MSLPRIPIDIYYTIVSYSKGYLYKGIEPHCVSFDTFPHTDRVRYGARLSQYVHQSLQVHLEVRAAPARHNDAKVHSYR